MGDLTAVSLFAGIGGFDKALQAAGIRTVAAVEIDPDCRGVLRRQFPGTAIFSDVREVTGEQLRAAGFVPSRGIITGGFPCFAAGTRILTTAGWFPIEDIRVGDLVLTHAGRWMPVTSTMSRVADHQVTVRGQGVPQIATTSEHPFYARSSRRAWVGRKSGSWRRAFGEPGWVDAGKMAGQFAAQILPPEEPDSHSPDLWWLVGRYLADGWTTSGSRQPSGAYKGDRVVICCAHDEADDLAERIARVTHATRSEDLTVTKFVITRPSFVEFVDRLGRGAAGKTLTRRELALPADKAEELLAGWLSGDGCRTQGRWKGTTVSRSLALSMALLAQRARGVVAALHETSMPSSCEIAGRVVGQRTQYQVVIPDRNRSAFIEGGFGWKLVRSATRTDGPVLVYNLSVRGDESYVADGAVVHNCQDLSVAGRRAGLGGARSGLFWEIMRLADELSPRWLLLENVPGLLSAVCPCPGEGACVVNGRAVRCGEWRAERVPGPADELVGDACPVCAHDWDYHDAGGFCSLCQDTCEGLPEVKLRKVFVPDVPHGIKGGACPGGCMAGHGGAMGTVLGALGKRGYGFAGRVLDAQFFGVPQRRRRVFIAGCLGDRAGPVTVLLEPEGGERHPAASRAARAGTASGAGGDAERAGVVGTLGTSGPGGGWRVGADEAAAGQLVAHAITAREAKGADSDATSGFVLAATLQGGGKRGHRIDAEGAAGGHLVAYALGSHAGAADGDQTNRSHDNGGPVGSNISEGVAYSLRAGRNQSVAAFPVALRGRDEGSQIEVGIPGDPAFTIRTPGGGSSYPMIAHALTSEGADASEDGTGRGTPLVTVPIAATLTSGMAASDGVREPGRRREDDVNLVAAPMAFSPQNSLSGGGSIGYNEIPASLQANKVMAVHAPAVGIAENQRGELVESAISHQLTAGGGKPGQGYGAVLPDCAVRRLTPMECERLQGFPDEWTRWRDDGTEQSDSARYRQCGNAVAVPVVQWIAERVAAVEAAAEAGEVA